MKKRYILIIILVLLLFLPVPSGVYKDGGTKTFTALTYKIVDWKHMYGNGTYQKFKIYPFPLNFYSIDSLLSREEKYFYTETKNIICEDEQLHIPAKEPQNTESQIGGYCGNTQTTVYFNNSKKYTFMDGESVTLTDILLNLDYKKEKMCKCRPEYTVDTEFGQGYGINISQSYARFENGQADLTKEQAEKIKKIILWAQEKAE